MQIRYSLPLLCFFAFSVTQLMSAPLNDNWIGTWATAPQAELNLTDRLGAADLTLRQIVHISVGGSSVRIVVTNEFGLDPLIIGAGNVAPRVRGSAIDPAKMQILTFNGHPSVIVPAGTIMVSDPVEIQVAPRSNLAVSLFVPKQRMRQATSHPFALQTNYIADGNSIQSEELASPRTMASWYFIKGVQVRAGPTAGSVVALGDSITDGASSNRDENGRWPDVLAGRILSNPKTAQLGVLDEGINGNRLLFGDVGGGESALARFDRDVLAQAGAKYLIILESINDIGHIAAPTLDDPATTTDALLLALTQLVERAHTHGIKVIGATVLPFEGCKYATADGEKMRQAVNQWIRSNKLLDGVVDLDKTIRDPANPTRFLPAYDSGDHLHPNTLGLKAMGDAFDLSTFTN